MVLVVGMSLCFSGSMIWQMLGPTNTHFIWKQQVREGERGRERDMVGGRVREGRERGRGDNE